MKNMNPRLRGSLEISVASVGFGFLGIFGTWAFESGMNVGELLSYRFALAAVLLWIFLLLFKPSWVKLNLRQTVIAALLGIFGYAFFSTMYFMAIDGLSITLAALLLYTYPFWVNIFSHFFTQDKISGKEALCLVAASSGLVMLLWGHIEVKNIWAVAAGLAAAISYAIYVLLSGRLQKNVRPITSALYVITFGALALSVFHHPHYSAISNLSNIQATSILGLALVCTIIPLTMELAALQKLKSTEVALLMMIEPITAALMGALIFHERLTPVQIVGALIIGAALVTNTLYSRPVSE
ncbi:EamA family transporter [Bdellovibrio bacteriovorus]|uniref:Transmembrane protein n=1 Tax=Bdellovibrio bacteriovorus str. Tiberius TaxID=1069642 RepID=K7YSK1_BDEBC|nr:DMT family transporter [Bdellovibrio bacteriovorus]AFY02861.1 transmembrane protein [Bdellovibrio bacteriovorus str. Tiberius]